VKLLAPQIIKTFWGFGKQVRKNLKQRNWIIGIKKYEK
jgi:hypothetical protein